MPRGRRLTVEDIPIGSEHGQTIVISAPYLGLNYGQSRTLVKARCVYEETPGFPCGREFEVQARLLITGQISTCGSHKSHKAFRIHKIRPSNAGSNHPRWKGGRRKMAGGYVGIWQPDHPNAGVRGYVLEHHRVMSAHLRRPIMPGETVHHINGKRDDNRLENLQLRISNHGSGQAYACSDCGSERISPVALKDSQEVALSLA